MRVIGTIPHPEFKVILYTLARYYYAEIEAGPMKQCFKLHKEHFSGPGEVKRFMDDDFFKEVKVGFERMYINYKESLGRYSK